MNKNHQPPRSSLKSISPIIVETESGIHNLYLTSHLGEIYVLLQDVAGKADYYQPVDIFIQHQDVLAAPAGTYIPTITCNAGNVIQQESVIRP